MQTPPPSDHHASTSVDEVLSLPSMVNGDGLQLQLLTTTILKEVTSDSCCSHDGRGVVVSFTSTSSHLVPDPACRTGVSQAGTGSIYTGSPP